MSFATRKTLALLIYLVVEGIGGTHLQPREKLATLFWPESDSSRGRAALRNTLRYLREALPTDEAGDTPHLIIERGALGFDFDSDYTLDLEVVEAAVETRHVASLREAVDVYRGDFLAGFSLGDAPDFDDWASFQREVWHRRLDTVFDRLSQLRLDRGDTEPAVATARRWVAHDPVNEAAYRRLMRAQFAAGDRTGALHTYESCTETLADEFGVEPAPETKALAARIRQADTVTVRAVVQPRSGGSTSEGGPHAEAEGPGEVPLVGRAEEFGRLVEGYHRAAGEESGAAAIIGEAGIGKSRLLNEFLSWAAAHGADVLLGRAFETGTHLPYQTLIDPLRTRIERENAPDDLLSDTWLGELTRLLPELRDRYPDLAPSTPDDDATARSRLLEAMARLIIALAGRTPLVLAIDDLQWADAASRDALHYVCRRCVEEQARVFVVATVREEALDPLSVTQEPAPVNWLRDLERVVPVTSVHVSALTEDETLIFLRELGVGSWELGPGERETLSPKSQFPDPTSRSFAQWLFSETGGHPFYLVETMKDLLERGHLRQYRDADGAHHVEVVAVPDAASRSSSVPDRVREVVTTRLNRLGPTAFSLLAASAVLGHGFTFELLCEVAGLSEDEGLMALDELLRGRLLQEVTGDASARGDGPYIFAHDKIRDVVYTDAGDARRRIFHRRALRALERKGAVSAELAHHAVMAGESEAAYRHSIAAGDAALDIFATGEAIRHYEQARTLLRNDLLSRPSDRDARQHLPIQRRHLYLSLGRAYELAGDYDRALATYDELEDIAQQRDDKELQLAALMARTTVYAAPTQHYDAEQVDVLTQRALPLARELEDHAAEAKILWNLMLLNLFTGDTRQAIEDGEASLAIAREHDLREQMAYSLHDLHRAYLATGQADEGLARLREARELWRALDNKAMLADGLVVEAGFLGLTGNLDRSLALSQEALDLSRSIDNLWNQSFSLFTMTPIYFERGEYGEAIEAGTASIELGRQAGFMVPMVGVGPIVGWIYALCGDVNRGLTWVARAVEQAGQMHASLLTGPLSVRGILHAMAGDLEEADRVLREAQAHFEPEANDFGALMLPVALPRVALAREEYDRAVETAGEMLAVMRARGMRVFVEDVLFLKGCALRALGRTDAAEAVLREARDEAGALTARRVLWRILVELAEIAAAAGDTERAADLREQAGDVVTQVADRVHDPELRRSFLQTPRVRALLA